MPIIIVNKITGFPLFTRWNSNMPTFLILIIFIFIFKNLNIFLQNSNNTKKAVLLSKFFVSFLFSLFLFMLFGILHIFELNEHEFIQFCHVPESMESIDIRLCYEKSPAEMVFLLFLARSLALNFFTLIPSLAVVFRDKRP